MPEAHRWGKGPDAPVPNHPPLQLVQITAMQWEQLVALLTPGAELARRYLAQMDAAAPQGTIATPVATPEDGADVVETADGGVLGG